MNDAEILAAIVETARSHLDREGPVSPEMRLVEDLQLDSLQLLTLAVALEDRFRIRLDDEEANLVTVADLVAAIRRKHGG